MIDRRRFLETGTLLSLGSLIPEAARPGTLPARRCPGLACAVVDARYEPSRAFAGELQRAAVTVHPMAGDVTQVWYEHLQPLWRASCIAVAGFTSYATLFCLERLGWDHGLRMVYRGVHASAADHRLEHRIAASAPLRQRLRLELRADTWPEGLARTLCSASPTPGWHEEPAIGSRTPQRRLTTRSARRSAGLPLYSWVIA